jgi:hypothetical protein
MSLFYYYYHLLTGDSYPPVLLPLGCLQLSLLEVIALDECLPDSALQEPSYRPERGPEGHGGHGEVFFANQEMHRKKGFESVEQLVSAISALQLNDKDATYFEDIFWISFSRMTAQARLGRLSKLKPRTSTRKRP